MADEGVYYDKVAAAEFLGYKSPETIRHHLYKSSEFPPGRMINGKRVWTREELEAFKAKNITPGGYNPPAPPISPRVFVAEGYVHRIQRGEVIVQHRRKVVTDVVPHPDPKGRAAFLLTYEDGDTKVIQPNVRLYVFRPSEVDRMADALKAAGYPLRRRPEGEWFINRDGEMVVYGSDYEEAVRTAYKETF